MVKKLSGSSQQEKRKRVNVNGITSKLAAELKVLEAMTDDQIDFSDIPLKLDWSKAERGRFYRPVKQLISLRVDADIAAWFKEKAKGKQYTPMMNKALRTYILAQEAKRTRK